MNVNATIDSYDSQFSNNSFHLKKKVIIPQQNYCIYVIAVSSFFLSDTQSLFELKIQESHTFFLLTFLLTFLPSVIADATTKSKSNKNPSIKLSVPIRNNSDEPVHVNKNTILRFIQEIEQTTNINPENFISSQQFYLNQVYEEIKIS